MWNRLMESKRRRNCVVVGASSGIGQEIAQQLVQEGSRVFGFARRFEQAEKNDDSKVVKKRLDVTDKRAVAEAFQALPEIDVFVYSAGGAFFTEAMETSLEDIDAMWKVHVSGAWSCFKNAFPKMVNEKSIALVIGSIAGTTYTPGCLAYSMAKTAQRVLWEHIVDPCRKRGIRTTHVALGAVDTPLWDSMKNASRIDMLNAKDVAQTILKCIDEPSLHVPELTILPKKGILEEI